MTVPVTSHLSPDTKLMLESAVADMMQNLECFYLLDVTNRVKLEGMSSKPLKGFGTHTEMAAHLRGILDAHLALGKYSRTRLQVQSGHETAYLYHPPDTSPATIYSHENRNLIALTPVEVIAAQSSQQATGRQAAQIQTATTGAASSIQRLGQHILSLLPGHKKLPGK